MITKKSLQNLNALIFLTVIAECKSKRKASEKLNTSIDTLNKYIINLEHALGMQLIINDNRGCRLTPRAKLIVDKIKNVENLLDYIYRQRPENDGYKGDVSVCVPLNISINFPRCYSSEFYNEYPDIRIVSTTTVESPRYEDLGVDIAIITQKPTQNNNFAVICKKVLKCGLFASDNYLNAYGYPKDLNDLQKNHRLVHIDGGYSGFNKMNHIVEKSNSVRFVTNSGACIASIIKNGVGIGTLPLHYKNEGFILLDNIEYFGDIEFYLLVNNKTRNIPRVMAVAEHYKNALEQPLPPQHQAKETV